MPQKPLTNELVKYLNKKIYKWEILWFEERKRYPVTIDIPTFEPLKENDEFHVQINPAPEWADNPEPLDIFRFILKKEDITKIKKIIEKIGLSFHDSIAYFTHAVIWNLDLIFAFDKDLQKLSRTSPTLYKESKIQLIGLDKFCSVLLYPPWKPEGYQTKISCPYYWGNSTEWYLENLEQNLNRVPSRKLSYITYNRIFKNIKIEDIPKYNKEFKEHENRLGLKKTELDYHFIPPKEIPQKKKRVPQLRRSQLIKIEARKQATKIWKELFPDMTVPDLYKRREIQAILEDGPFGTIKLKTFRKWVTDINPNPNPGRRPKKEIINLPYSLIPH